MALQKILQIDWPKASSSITQEPDFCQNWGLLRDYF